MKPVQLKHIKCLLVIVIACTLLSCHEGVSKQPANAAGFMAIEKALKSKFGANAFYTDLSITYHQAIGNIIDVTVTEAPESLKMGQWNLTQNTWSQNQDIAIEVPKGNMASDFMFQLNQDISLLKLGELIEKSSQVLSTKKKLKQPILQMAFINFPNNGVVSKTEYVILLKPKRGGATFKFAYHLNGDLIEMTD